MSNVIEIKNIKQSITDSGLDVIYEICVNNNFFQSTIRSLEHGG